MSMFDFWWNSVQAGQIAELEERIEKLEKQNQILYEWVQHFKQVLQDKDQND